jgi:hypothetical protein
MGKERIKYTECVKNEYDVMAKKENLEDNNNVRRMRIM